MSNKNKIRFNDVAASAAFREVCNDLEAIVDVADVSIIVTDLAISIVAKVGHKSTDAEHTRNYIRATFAQLCKIINLTKASNPIRQIKVLDIVEDEYILHSRQITNMHLLPDGLSFTISSAIYHARINTETFHTSNPDEAFDWLLVSAPFGNIDQETLDSLKDEYFMSTEAPKQQESAKLADDFLKGVALDDAGSHTAVDVHELTQKVLGEVSMSEQYNCLLQMVFEARAAAAQMTTGGGMHGFGGRLQVHSNALNESRLWLNQLLAEVIRRTHNNC